MANKPKTIGTGFETECVKAFKVAGFKARRLALSGADDQGDVELITSDGVCVIECKCYKSWSRAMVELWREQTRIEERNYSKAYNVEASSALIVSQYRKSLSESYVHIRTGDRWVQMYFDEFIAMLLKAEGVDNHACEVYR